MGGSIIIVLWHPHQDIVRHGKTGGSGRVNRVTGQTGHRSKTGHFKRVEIRFGSIGLRVGSG